MSCRPRPAAALLLLPRSVYVLTRRAATIAPRFASRSAVNGSTLLQRISGIVDVGRDAVDVEIPMLCVPPARPNGASAR